MKNINTKAYLAVYLITLFLSSQANAGFREALSALQHRNAEKMLSDIDAAVSNNNVDSFTLFIETLDEWYYAEDFVPESVKNDRLRRDYRLPENYEQLAIRWDGFLNKSQQLRLLNLLKKVKMFDFPESVVVTNRLINNLQKNQFEKVVKISEDNLTPYYFSKEKMILESFYQGMMTANSNKSLVIDLFQTNPPYALEIYDYGLIRYSSSNRSYRTFDKNILEVNLKNVQVSGLYEWKISPKQVELLVNDLRTLDIGKLPENMSTSILCDTGERQAHTFVSFNGRDLVKKIHFQGWAGHKDEVFPEQGAILRAIEKHVPINQFLCGENPLIVGYSSCVIRNMRSPKVSQSLVKPPQVEK